MSENTASVNCPTNMVTLSDTQAATLAQNFLPYIRAFIDANRDEFELWKQERKTNTARRSVNHASEQ